MRRGMDADPSATPSPRMPAPESPITSGPYAEPVAITPTPAPERAGAGIPGSDLSGPYDVGEYARALRARLRAFAHVQLMGELVNLRPSRARVYFELRDATGAIPCAVWLTDWESILARAGVGGAPIEGMQVVVAGGCDFYPGSATSSPGFSFSVSDLRVAGEGDLLARIERLRKQLDAEGLLAPQKLLPRPLLPRTIGVITGETGKARDDILAGLHRRGWAGTIVWGFAPVQDRHAAPLISRALTDSRRGGQRGRRDRRARRRLAGRPAVLLRRVAVPHRRAAGRARDRLCRAPHRPDAARRRRGVSARPRPTPPRPPWAWTAPTRARSSSQARGACANRAAVRCSRARER